ncbi:hypothetical protein jhhlp_001586 [Lomentospora prolificans]|uniref:2,5-diamino-6-ribosylamino-4(3H)-pyrimidinone 5'-phosphate reductase n=1 Tax=Lomentospora prolificans TaxID=41688 RepID=A0A2N3NIL3_9PEZI|nr:hypothetical protein jhhlp_001586 [Lomentospora prolificans]
MRSSRYSVAISLDGYIGPHDHSTAWITDDASIDFAELYSQFDIFIMGRTTYEVMRAQGDANPFRTRPKESIFVVSQSMRPSEYPEVTVLGANFLSEIKKLKEQEGKDIWLFGGGQLLGSCLDAGLVDTIEAAIMPTLLRGGIKMVSDAAANPGTLGTKLELVEVRRLESSGILMTTYKVRYH